MGRLIYYGMPLPRKQGVNRGNANGLNLGYRYFNCARMQRKYVISYSHMRVV